MNLFKYLFKPDVVSRALRIKAQGGSIPETLCKEAKEFYRAFPRKKFFIEFFGKRNNITVAVDNKLGAANTYFMAPEKNKPFSILGQTLRFTEKDKGINIKRVIKTRINNGVELLHERVVRSKDGNLLNLSNRYYKSIRTPAENGEFIYSDRKLLSSKFTDFTKI